MNTTKTANLDIYITFTNKSEVFSSFIVIDGEKKGCTFISDARCQTSSLVFVDKVKEEEDWFEDSISKRKTTSKNKRDIQNYESEPTLINLEELYFFFVCLSQVIVISDRMQRMKP